jgi:hypothetical protein
MQPSPAQQAETIELELRLLLVKASQLGSMIYEWCNANGEPEARAVAYLWEDAAADVVIVRVRTNEGVAYRTPPCNDHFVPAHVTERERGTPVHVLRAALTWDHWGKERAPRPFSSPPPDFGLPLDFRLGHTEKLLMPRAGAPIIRPPMPMPLRLPQSH